MFTSLITAYQLACTIVNKNFEGFSSADEEGNTRAIFENKAKYLYSLLPEAIRPSEKYNNAKQLLFEKLNSSWEIKTASKNMGRSRTINFWHGSEAAFWKDGIAPTQASIGEALTKDAVVILESTANGYNEYKDLWDGEVWVNCFYQWWLTDEYQYNFESKAKKEQFYDMMQKDTWIADRCKWLLEYVKLREEQVYWYYNKYLNYIDKNLIKQEYPCTPEEAFISSGRGVFDIEKLAQRKKFLEDNDPTLKVGRFEIEWYYQDIKDGEGNVKPVKTKIKDFKWVDDRNGFITIYKDVIRGAPYALGGDTSGEGSDWFVGDVIDNTTKEQVAQIRHEFDEDTFAEQCYCLGKYYNNAMIGFEINHSTHPTKRLEDLYYNRLYIRETVDSYTKKMKKSYGFQTNIKTRPLLIADLVALVRDNVELINSIQTIKEMLTFVKNEKGKPEAEAGKHDDCVLSLGITHHVGVQQIDYIEEERAIPDYIEEDDEDYDELDGGCWFD